MVLSSGSLSTAAVQADKFPVHGYVVQGFFHGRVGQAKPLLHEVDAQQGQYRKGRTTGLASRRMRRNQPNQLGPGYDQVHFIEELALARPLDLQLKSPNAKAICLMIQGSPLQPSRR